MICRCPHCNGTFIGEYDLDFRCYSFRCLACGRSPQVVAVEPIPDRPSTRVRFPQTCELCGAIYLVTRSSAKARHFCSSRCGNLGRGRHGVRAQGVRT